MTRLLYWYEWAAGLCDGCTGLLLLFAPAWTLHLMHITVPPAPIQFASFVGVFVFAVGATYVWAAVRWRPLSEYRTEWKTQWILTALIRTSVAVFLTTEVAAGAMEPAWMLVAVSDGSLAAVQWIGVVRGWLVRRA